MSLTTKSATSPPKHLIIILNVVISYKGAPYNLEYIVQLIKWASGLSDFDLSKALLKYSLLILLLSLTLFPCRSFQTSPSADRNGQRLQLSVLPRVPNARAETGHARVLLLLVAHREDGAVQEQRAQRAALPGGTAKRHRVQDVPLHGFPTRVGLHVAAAFAQEEAQPA